MTELRIGDRTITRVGCGDVRLATATARNFDPRDVERAVHAALELGIAMLDAADEAAAERLCGDAVRALRLRDRVVVACRVPELAARPGAGWRGGLLERLPVGHVQERIEASLRATRLDALPLAQLPLRGAWRASPAWPELVGACARMVREGKVLAWGALCGSGAGAGADADADADEDTADDAELLRESWLASISIPYSLCERGAEPVLVAAVRAARAAAEAAAAEEAAAAAEEAAIARAGGAGAGSAEAARAGGASAGSAEAARAGGRGASPGTETARAGSRGGTAGTADARAGSRGATAGLALGEAELALLSAGADLALLLNAGAELGLYGGGAGAGLGLGTDPRAHAASSQAPAGPKVVLARRPLAGGALAGTLGPGAKLAVRDDRRSLDAAALERVAVLAARLAPLVERVPPAARSCKAATAALERGSRPDHVEALTLAELALRFVLARGAVALPRLHRVPDVAEALGAAAAPPLSQALLDRIDDLLRDAPP